MLKTDQIRAQNDPIELRYMINTAIERKTERFQCKMYGVFGVRTGIAFIAYQLLCMAC